MATYKEVKEIFEKYDIDHDEYESIYNSVLKVNSKLQAIDKTIDDWGDLPPHQIEMVIKHFNSDEMLKDVKVTISLKEYLSLKEDELKLTMLQEGGVNNWQWYVDDRKSYDERRKWLKDKLIKKFIGDFDEK
jgi:hypothetical protein